MRVLFITQKADRNDPVLGFMHAWFVNLSERLDALHLLVLESGSTDLPGNVFIHSMGKDRGAGRARKFLAFLRVMAALVLRRRVDAVFAHMCPIYAVLAAPFCRIRRIPLVMWITHSSDTPTLRLAHRLVDKVVTASPASCALSGAKVVVTGHGIDTDLFSPGPAPEPDSRTRILSVGRVTPIKDYMTLIRATEILIRERHVSGFEVCIVGACYSDTDKQHQAELQAAIDHAGLSGIVRFEGPTTHDKMPAWYRSSHIFASTCHTHALDKAVLEAMACGVASTTCIESFKPLLDQAGPGFCFEKGGASALADILERLLTHDPAARIALGMKQRNLVLQHHGFKTLMDRLVREIGDSITEK